MSSTSSSSSSSEEDDARSGVVGERPADVEGCASPAATTDGGGGRGRAEEEEDVAGNLWRLVPASELRCVGAAWLWSPVKVRMKVLGSARLRSSCFRAGQPLAVLHR
jgi:hypothetical protein